MKMPVYPMPRRDPLEPPLEYAGLRESDPVARVRLWDGSQAWLVTRYDTVRALLACGVLAGPLFMLLYLAQALARRALTSRATRPAS